jgi:FkbH-like protein
MFQFDWASQELWAQEPVKLSARQSKLEGCVRGAMVLQWHEHCIECAIPGCYTTCPLYVRRRDQKCARLVYGIFRNREFKGLLGCGADMRFRRWGKIEARLSGRYMSLSGIRLLDRADRAITSIVSGVANLLSGIDPKRRINGALALYRGKLLNKLGRRGVTYDRFAVECYCFEENQCRMIVELTKSGMVVFREGLELRSGYNYFSPAIALPPRFGPEDHYELKLYPDGDKEIRVVFSWLDFVIDTKKAAESAAALDANKDESAARPAEKVKCVAWDLDNTLWEGILVEDGEQKIRLRAEAVELVRWFDERGIVETIVSKNNHDDAMAVLARLGLDEFFLYPAINWGQKSASLRQIADRLNINIDTFALIDDSAFERREVGSALPMVRIYREDELEQLRSLPEFDVPVTEASRKRRKSYLTEMERERAKEVSGADYLGFLRSCQLKLRLFHPFAKEEIVRCLELIQRSNQLNLSSRRYNADEFDALLADQNVLSIAMECEDRFGAYGIVGFASIDIGGEDPVAKDFVLSCRVAQKHVEHAFYSWLGDAMKRDGAKRLLVDLVKTARNRPLVKVFEEMPFATVRAEGDSVLLSLDLRGDVDRDDVVTLDDSAVGTRRVS